MELIVYAGIGEAKGVLEKSRTNIISLIFGKGKIRLLSLILDSYRLIAVAIFLSLCIRCKFLSAEKK